MNVRNIGDKKADKSWQSDINVQIDRMAYGGLSVLQVSQHGTICLSIKIVFTWIFKRQKQEKHQKLNIFKERIETNLFSGRSNHLVPRDELHLTGGVIQHKTPIHWSLTRWWARLEISLKRGRFTRMVRSCGQQMLHFTKSWSPFHQTDKSWPAFHQTDS